MTGFCTKVLGVAVKSKGAKVGGIIGTSGGLIALIFGLHSDVTNKIEIQGAHAKEYTDLKIETVKTELRYLKDGQTEIKALILRLNK